MVHGLSGRVYIVSVNQRPIRVIENNKEVATICIHTDQNCPPTDHILNMKITIECDELSIWSNGNVRLKSLIAL